jgi:glycerate dehydrogenase
VEYYDFTAPEDVPARAQGAAVLVTNKSPIRSPLIEASTDLRFITVTATGFDCVDASAARGRDIPVSNVPEYSTNSVAQHVFALLLEMCVHVGRHAEAVRVGEWSLLPDFSMRKTPLIELAGKTMGVVGFGRIGQRVGKLAEAFGMSVLANSPSRRSPADGRPVNWCEIDELFRQSDVISLHCPLTPQNVGLVNRNRLNVMKSNAILINTARGALVVEDDLAEALNTGRIAGAAVDVVTKEPILRSNPLLAARNCLITPHNAWATEEARHRLMEATVANVASFLAGTPINVVN